MRVSRSLLRSIFKAQADGGFHKSDKFYWRCELMSSLIPYYLVLRYRITKSSPIPPRNMDCWEPVCELDFNKVYEIKRKYYKNDIH